MTVSGPRQSRPRAAVDGAELGELRDRALLRAFARRDPRVHQDVPVATDEGRQRAQPPAPLIERGSELGPDIVQAGCSSPFEQRALVVPHDGERIETARELQDTSAVWTTIDQVAAQCKPVVVAVESRRAQQIVGDSAAHPWTSPTNSTSRAPILQPRSSPSAHPHSPL